MRVMVFSCLRWLHSHSRDGVSVAIAASWRMCQTMLQIVALYASALYRVMYEEGGDHGGGDDDVDKNVDDVEQEGGDDNDDTIIIA